MEDERSLEEKIVRCLKYIQVYPDAPYNHGRLYKLLNGIEQQLSNRKISRNIIDIITLAKSVEGSLGALYIRNYRTLFSNLYEITNHNENKRYIIAGTPRKIMIFVCMEYPSEKVLSERTL